MTALILEGFDHYGTGEVGAANMSAGPWGSVGNASDGNGIGTPSFGARTGPYALGNSSILGAWRRVLPASKTSVILSMGFAIDSLPSAVVRNGIVAFLDGGGTGFLSLYVTPTGAIQVYDGAGALVASTQGPVLTVQNWHFLEMKIDSVAGTFELHVDDAGGDGDAAILATGLTLSPTSILQFLSLPTQSFPTKGWVDDIMVTDTSGSHNNGFHGDVRIAALFPRGDNADHDGWTPRYRKEFGDGILDNRAAGACVTAANSASTNLGAADFTIEGWFRFLALPTGANKAVLFGKWDDTNNGRSYQLYVGGPALDSGNLTFRTSTDGTAATVEQKISYPYTPELNEWTHFALVRSSGELLLFIQGVQYGLPIADADTYFASSSASVLGAQMDGGDVIGGTSFSGFQDEFRLTVGVARYTAPFTPTGPFPRSAPDDPDFADVAWLSGWDSGIFDESSFARALAARGGAVQNTPDDGPAIGAYSAINQHVPRDDTFIEAALVPASSVLTLDAQVAAADTVTVGTTNGVTPAVYTFRAAVATAYDVKIGVDAADSLENLFNAINAGPGSGTLYGTGTIVNADVEASQLPGDQMLVTATIPGVVGNAVATSASLANGGSWDGATLAGGMDIPGDSDFYVDRPPPLTTVIRAVAIIERAYKSDSGIATINSALVGPLEGSTDGADHSLTLTPTYYQDIYETDPDTGNAITPTTVVGGRIRFNRSA